MSWRPYSPSRQYYALLGAPQVDVSNRLHNMRRVQSMKETNPQDDSTSAIPTQTTELNDNAAVYHSITCRWLAGVLMVSYFIIH